MQVKRNKQMTRFEDTAAALFVSDVVGRLLTLHPHPSAFGDTTATGVGCTPAQPTAAPPSPRALGNVLWALGRLGVNPGLVTLNRITDLLTPQLQAAGASAGSLSNR
jgi:hypothetical protein